MSMQQPGLAAPPWSAPRPPVAWPGALAGLLLGAGLVAVAQRVEPAAALVPGPMGDIAAAAAGYLAGHTTTALAERLLSVYGLPATVALLSVAVLVAGAGVFAVGRLAVGPLWRRYGWRPPPPRMDRPPPAWLRALLFLLPPPPSGPPLLVQRGVLIVAATHLLPPPGPAALRLVVDAFLGASACPLWKYACGAALGVVAHVAIVAWLAEAGIALPSAPSGLALVALLIAPILVVAVVRLGARGVKRLRAGKAREGAAHE